MDTTDVVLTEAWQNLVAVLSLADDTWYLVQSKTGLPVYVTERAAVPTTAGGLRGNDALALNMGEWMRVKPESGKGIYVSGTGRIAVTEAE